MQEIKISIIIPIYNAQQYLTKCVNSVLNQSFVNFELILVDDGSKDNSLKLCQELAKKDSRIKVIHQENGGAASAKNLGLQLATGEYIAFVDSDDYIDSDYIKNLYLGVEHYQADLCIGSISFLTMDVEDRVKSKKITDITQGIYSLEDFMKFYPKYMPQAIIGAPWNKLYSRKIIIQNKIFFNVELRNNEDTHFNYEYLPQCKTVYVSHEPNYNYISRLDITSASRGYIPNIFSIYLITFEKAKKFLKQINYYNEYINFQNKYFISLVIGAINSIAKTNKLQKRDKLYQIKNICETKEVCEAARNIKYDKIKKNILLLLIKQKRYRELYWLCYLNK